MNDFDLCRMGVQGKSMAMLICSGEGPISDSVIETQTTEWQRACVQAPLRIQSHQIGIEFFFFANLSPLARRKKGMYMTAFPSFTSSLLGVGWCDIVSMSWNSQLRSIFPNILAIYELGSWAFFRHRVGEAQNTRWRLLYLPSNIVKCIKNDRGCWLRNCTHDLIFLLAAHQAWIFLA